MDSQTRRQVLAVAATAAGGLAGCLSSQTSTRTSQSSTERPGQRLPEQATTDPPVLLRRGDGDQPPIRLREEAAADGDGDGDNGIDSPSDRRAHYTGTKLIDDTATADRLVDSSDDLPADRPDLSTFLSETDFERETLYLETKQIRQCFELSLCYIAWDSGIETDYGRVLRPYDEECTADRRVFESRLFRLPVALDIDTVNSFGSSTRSGRCRRIQTADGPANGSTESGSTNRSAPSNGSDES